MIFDRTLFRRAVAKRLDVPQEQKDAVLAALNSRETLDKIHALMRRQKATRLTKLSSLAAWIKEHWRDILSIIGFVIMFLEENPDAESSEPSSEKTDGHESEQLQPLGGTSSADAPAAQGPDEVRPVPVPKTNPKH